MQPDDARDVQRSGRDERGRFRPGNAIGSTTRFEPGNWKSAQHALSTDRLPPELEHLRAELAEFIDSSIADEGGAAECSRRRLALLEYRSRLHRRIVQLDAALELNGLFDRRGKLRVAWLQRLEALIGAARAIDTLLGLGRRQKPVPSITEALREGEPR